MKTKYKILIACTLVLSMLTAFAVTSFAAENHNDIVYDGNTFTYNETINISNHNLQIWDYDSIDIILPNGTTVTYEHDYIILSYGTDDDVVYLTIIYNGSRVNEYALSSNDAVKIILVGDYKYGSMSGYVYTQPSNITNINNTQQAEYDVWYNSGVSSTIQINLLNNTIPNPLEKVDDFLGYLSTSLTKLTTMIITNQILILFIVAVPVVSFVIGSFKRIKDTGRA